MGSKADFEFCQSIGKVLNSFDVKYIYRVASAHKTPLQVLEILKQENEFGTQLYITVAGKSNALSGFVDANTTKPVIACPQYSEKFFGADIFSSLRMPSGSGLMTVLEPEAAALAAIKLLALEDHSLQKKLKKKQAEMRDAIMQADEEIKKRGQR